MNERRTALFIFLTGLFVFTFATASLEFLRIDCRFGLFAMEMKEYGISMFPTLYGKAYTDYPATQSILMHFFSEIFGRVSMFTASLPSGIAAALTLSFIYLIGASRSRSLGLYAVIFSFLTYGFLSAARSTSTDMFIAAIATVAFFIIHSSEERGPKTRLLFIPFLLAAGFAFRGPIGLIVPAAVVFAYYIIGGKYKKAVAAGAVSGFVLLLCMALFYYAALTQGGREFADEIIKAQIHGRMSKSRPLLYYFTNSFGLYSIAYPLALVILASSWKKIIGGPDDKNILLMKQLAAWAFVIMAGLSIPGTKHLRYMLPAVPAFCLICAFLFECNSRSSFIFFCKSLLVKLSIAIPVLAAIALFAAAVIFKYARPPFEINANFLFTGIIFLILSGLSCFALRRLKTTEQKDFMALSIAALSVIVLNISVIEPILQGLESSAAFVKQTEAMRLASGGRLFFFRTGPDGEDIKYMVNTDKPFKPGFISSTEDIETIGTGDIIVTEKPDFEKLPAELKNNCSIVSEGKLGHNAFVAFQYNPSPKQR